ncbi:primary-amine oxidase [Acidisoma silvae]|uniref:Amine oxidase n=1 Tax=Acidisoma silvae TaxID=2802396 RepID=A0A963YSF2_9PROT|nr:primary-amine oxidase [Acidisoma silvae]
MPAYRALLEPLNPAEIRAVVAIIKADAAFGDAVLFETIEAMDPPKSAVVNGSPLDESGAPISRRARANVFHGDVDGVWKLTVSLDDKAILTRAYVPTARPMIQLEQFMQVEGWVKADPRFIAACAGRGITDMEKVCVDPWSAGNFGYAEEDGRLLCHTFAWLRLYEDEAFYAHPIEGLNAVVDVKSGEVIRVDDRPGPPIPMTEVNYDSKFLTDTLPPLKPLNIVQPDGVSFTLTGHHLAWDRWAFNIGFNAREGLTLHDIRFDGRPLVNRASLVEMVVPYGSPDRGHFRKNVFDIGEYGLGKLANSLKLGCDCLGVIQYLDAHMNTMTGDIFSIEKAICIHEEDSGILWKHWDFRTERTQVRRGRKLVVSCICTVGNYEYAQYWYFNQSGEIEFEMKATGIINTVGIEPGKPSKYETEVSPGVAGQIHQHIFCARLDMAIDGEKNTVVECNTQAEPAESNPYGNAFFETQTAFKTEQEGSRRANPASQRYWKVTNPSVTNAVGQPTAYKLMPTNTVTSFLVPSGPSGSRSNFVENHLWVSAHDAEERYPAGDFMNHSDGRGGIKDFVAQDRAIENASVTLWHVFGLHHSVRVEDFPVQPCISTGFKLMPTGFFNGNPAINVAESVNSESRHAGSCCA